MKTGRLVPAPGDVPAAVEALPFGHVAPAFRRRRRNLHSMLRPRETGDPAPEGSDDLWIFLVQSYPIPGQQMNRAAMTEG